MVEQSIYTVGGTVQAGGGIYIKRKADDELLNLCRQGEFAFILSSRQIGKSSLMVRTAQQLEHENIRTVIIDLTSIGTDVSREAWYLGILSEIQTALNLHTDIFAWWAKYAELGQAQRLTNFIRDVLLEEVSQQVVIFFDEIDSTLSIPFADDFFIALRAVYNARSTTAKFKRISFVLIGVATPSDLISDNRRTPFNIGRRVELNDFTLEEALPLVSSFGSQAKQILEWVLHFTGGHPYLTQKLCLYLAESMEPITEQFVARTTKQLFTGEQGKLDTHIQFIRDMLSSRSPDVRKVLLIYGDIRSGKKVRDDEHSITKSHLKLSGLVRSENGFLCVRNEIYNSVFNNQWVQENTPTNWLKIATVSLSFITFVLLSIFIYDLVVENISNQYTAKFYTSYRGSERLKPLANLFELRGITQNTDYDFRARELFYSLNWDEQIRLFQDASITQSDKQKYLPTIVEGLYVTMANVDGGQDSSELLRVMRDSLQDLVTVESKNLYTEISLWLDARNALQYQEALDSYNDVIQLNPNNPATRYERSKIEFRLEQYEQALIDLDATIALAQNLSTEASEREIATPTPWPTKTQIETVTTPGSEAQSTPESTPLPVDTTPGGVFPNQSTQAPTPDVPTSELNPDIGTEIPFVPEQNPVERTSYSISGYKSSFYSIAYIRSAVGLVLQDYRSQIPWESSLAEKFTDLPNLRSAGLLPELDFNTPTGIQQSTDPQSTNVSPPLLPISVYTDTNIYITSNQSGKREIYLVTETIQPVTLTPGEAESWSPVLSGNGDLYFTSNRDGKAEIFKLTTAGETLKVTSTLGEAESWSPYPYGFGELYFTSNRSGKAEIYKLRDGLVEQVTNTPGEAESWSPVQIGSDNLYFTSNRDGKAEIYRLSKERVQRVTHTPGTAESWSPALKDNRILYFTSNRDGKAEIYRLLSSGQIERVTNTPGDAESWSPVLGDNGELYFTSNQGGITTVFVLVKDNLYYAHNEDGSQSWVGSFSVNPTSVPENIVSPAVKVVDIYFRSINDAVNKDDLIRSWNLLTNNFQCNPSDKCDFSTYRDWWWQWHVVYQLYNCGPNTVTVQFSLAPREQPSSTSATTYYERYLLVEENDELKMNEGYLVSDLDRNCSPVNVSQ